MRKHSTIPSRVKHSPYPSPEVRFWNATDKRGPDDCWPWKGAHQPFGYGHFWVNGAPYLAHRFSYELHHGPIPTGGHICHRCDNPNCVNPAHLFAGTQRDNVRDMRSKGRAVNPPRSVGVSHHAARLSEADVQTIRRRYAAGESQSAIGRDYGMKQGTISNIVRRKSWRHVP